jgi:hypothetical protein
MWSDLSAPRAFVALAALFLAIGCDSTPPLVLPDAGPASDAAAPDTGGDTGPPIALALIRVVPDHGPFSGGQTAILRGAGFASSAIMVRFGEVSVPPADVRRIDPNRLEVVVPARAPGVVDVSLDDGTTTRTLEAGYTYDAIDLSPRAGPPSGQTRLTLRSASDAFEAGVEVRLDGLPCTELEVVSGREARCRTPAHAIGSVDVEVRRGAERTVLGDAFTYENPFRPFGGLGGGPLDGTLTVMVRDYTGAPLEGALVVAGPAGALSHRVRSGPDGLAVLTGEDLRGRVDVVVSETRCHHHLGFLGTDAAYVSASLRLANLVCVTGGGGAGPPGDPVGSVSGEIVFFGGQEFPEPVWDWTGVPEPGRDQQRVAYVYFAGPRELLGGDGTSASVSSPLRVTEADRGAQGYRFTLDPAPSGTALVPFAVAGIEDMSSGGRGGDGTTGFVPHVVGLGRPVTVPPDSVRSGVVIRMDVPLGDGRSVRAEALDTTPSLGVDDGVGLAALDNVSSLQLLVRYAIPGVVAGLPLGLGEENDQPRGSAGEAVRIVRQPRAQGSFSDAEQEVFAILLPPSTSAWWNWYQTPHTRTLLRGPLGSSELRANDFLSIPAFDVPAAFDAPLPADRTLRISFEDEGASLVRIRVRPDFGGGLVWDFFAHPSVRTVTLPDLRGEDDLEPLPSGLFRFQVWTYDIPGLEFDRIDLRAVDALPVRRSSFNQTSFSAE